MHMADALISPAVGAGFWAASAALLGYCCKKIKAEFSDRLVPLMGVTGAFVFAAQMINFTIPGTGSSGHLGGGMILAILLGPSAGFLVMASILTVQALFFADGGLLALGCNIFNLGVWSCFVAYPLVYKNLVRKDASQAKLFAAAIISAVLALQLGAFCVVVQTVLSSISELPFTQFVLAMQPIHLAIGIVEGFITAGVVAFVAKAQPQLLQASAAESSSPMPASPTRLMIASLLFAAVITAGFFSWFASAHPDGLEWSMAKTGGSDRLETPDSPIYDKLAAVQEKTAFLPDYGFKSAPDAAESEPAEEAQSWPAIDAGTTVAGLVGGVLTLLLAFGIGFLLKLKKPLNPPLSSA